MLGLHLTLSLAFYPQSAVCSPQSAFYTDWFSIYAVTTFLFAPLLKPSFINVLINCFFVSLKMVAVPTVTILIRLMTQLL